MFVSVQNADGSFSFVQGVDEHGNPVKRSKCEHPYSYDGFVQWRGLPQSELNQTLYSDRIRQHHFDKWDELQEKHFGEKGDYFDHRSPTAIEAFLRELLDKPNYQLGLIMEYCNVSNGYPVWRFDVKTNIQENPKN